MSVGVAEDMKQVLGAWQLVFRSYLREGLIDPNPFRIHFTPQAVNPDTCVIIGRISELTVSTVTVVPDGDAGLPLDSVYRQELDDLRRKGRRLLEAGLLADRREHIARSLPAVLEIMRYAIFRTYHTATDIMAGVHPHHTGFYKRYMAFEEMGPVRTYPVVNNQPVVMLRLPLHEKLRLRPLPKGLAFFMRDPVPASAYEDRFGFDQETVRRSAIGKYVRYKTQVGGALRDAGVSGLSVASKAG